MAKPPNSDLPHSMSNLIKKTSKDQEVKPRPKRPTIHATLQDVTYRSYAPSWHLDSCSLAFTYLTCLLVNIVIDYFPPQADRSHLASWFKSILRFTIYD